MSGLSAFDGQVAPRTFARATQWPKPAVGPDMFVTLHDYDRSWDYGHDALNRLADARMRRLTDDNTDVEPAASTPRATHRPLTRGGRRASPCPARAAEPLPRAKGWNLDNLGNWSGGGLTPGGSVPNSVIESLGEQTVSVRHHAVNPSNQPLTNDRRSASRRTASSGTAASFVKGQITQIAATTGGTAAPPVTVLHDPAGNLVFDGTWYYQPLTRDSQAKGASFWAGKSAISRSIVFRRVRPFFSERSLCLA